MIKLYLVRHGETTFNVEARIQGQSDSPLTPLGLRQAEIIAERLARENGFDAIYSSDLSRAADTAKVIADRQGLQVHLTELLRERAFGVLQGLTHPEIEERFPESEHEWRRDPVRSSPPGAETRQDIISRCGVFVQQVLRTHNDGERIIVVGHGGSIRGILISALDLPVEFFTKVHISNTSLSILDIGERPSLRLFNDTCHMDSCVTFEDVENVSR